MILIFNHRFPHKLLTDTIVKLLTYDTFLLANVLASQCGVYDTTK